MTPFTESEMLDELRTIFLYEAAHIELGAGPSYAEQFIGFSTEASSYVDEPVERVDLDRFAITRLFRWAYRAAFFPSVTEWCGGLEEHNELITFMQGVPRIGSASGGEFPHFVESDGHCRVVTDLVHARWKLQWDNMGGHTFTTRELALLANMSEGAVRNAISDKSGNGLRPIAGAKPVSVDHEEAWRWLQGRRGFVPIPQRPADDHFLHAILKDVENATAFGKLIADRLKLHQPSKEVLLTQGWCEEDLAAWSDGAFVFDQNRAAQLAKDLDLDVFLFVGKALEVSLRRDALNKGGA